MRRKMNKTQIEQKLERIEQRVLELLEENEKLREEIKKSQFLTS